MDLCSIGIIGCSRIAEIAVARPALNLPQLSVCAIAGRQPGKASEFAKRYRIPRAFDSYEDLLACPDVTGVYVGLPNHLHLAWVLAACKSNKHVLVEKPLCLNVLEAELISTAKRSTGKVILEGLMVQYHPWQQFLRNFIQSETGRPTLARSRICFQLGADRIRRGLASGTGGGVFYDLAPYWLQFLQATVGLNFTNLKASSVLDRESGCEVEFEGALTFADNFRAEFFASYLLPYEASHTFTCEQASVTVTNMFRCNIGRCEMHIDVFNRKGNPSRTSFPAQNYFENQLERFRLLLREPSDDQEFRQSLDRVRVMDQLREAMEYRK